MKPIKLIVTVSLLIIGVFNVKAQSPLTKSITKAELDKVFQLNHEGKMIMQMIPVKATADVHVKDISINAYFFDMNGKLIWPADGGLNETFVKGSANYIRYIRTTHKPGDLITFSYHQTLSKQALDGKTGLAIYIYPYNYSKNIIVILPGGDVHGIGAIPEKKCLPDTGFKCPPACSVFFHKYQLSLRDQLKN